MVSVLMIETLLEMCILHRVGTQQMLTKYMDAICVLILLSGNKYPHDRNFTQVFDLQIFTLKHMYMYNGSCVCRREENGMWYVSPKYFQRQ